MNCLNCGKEVSDRAKYCGDACRKAYSRKSDKQPGQKADISEVKSDKSQSRTDENVRVECHSEKGDKWCSCGARIWPVLHPMGPHEVIYDKETWFLQSFYVGYVPEITRRGIDVGECKCGFCSTKRIERPKKEKVDVQ